MEYSENLYKNTVLTSDISLKCCGRRLNALNHHFGPLARENCFIILLKRGSGRLTVNKRVFALKEGMLFVCFPETVTSYSADTGSIWDICWIGINGTNLLAFLAYVGITTENPLKTPKDFQHMEEIMSRIYTLHGESIKHNAEALALVYSFLASLIPEDLKEESESDHISRAIRYMKHNFDRDIEIFEIADHVGLERVYFSKLFKKSTGLSPKDMLTKHRMEKAVYYMDTKRLPINEIARSVGYDDPLYFSRAFKKYFGICPTEYMKGMDHSVSSKLQSY